MATKAHIPALVRENLLSNSQNRCFNPSCDEPLQVKRGGLDVRNYEIAHICDENPPRSRDSDIGWRYYAEVVSLSDRNAYENLILLCAQCHKIVDKRDPRSYPADLLLEWKRSAENAGLRRSGSLSGAASHSTFEETGWASPLPARDQLFFGRASCLEALEKSVEESRVRTVGLLGPGGIGKTSICVEFAWRRKHTFSFIRWLNGHSRSALIEGFLDLGQSLGITSPHPPDDDVIENIRTAIEQSDGPWLLVIDGADELVGISQFLPFSDQGTVLVTTRSRRIAGLLNRLIEVPVPSSAEAGRLVERATGASLADACRLADRVENIPLALRQVSALVEAVGLTASEVLDELDKSAAEVLGFNDARAFHPDGREMVVLSCWNASISYAEARSVGSRWLCETLSTLSGDPIPLSLVWHLASAEFPSVLAARRSLGALADLSLVRLDPGSGVVTINAFMQEVVRLNTADTDSRYQHAILGCAEWVHWNIGGGDDPAASELVGHLSVLLGATEHDALRLTTGRREIAELLCSYHRNSGFLDESRSAGEIAVRVAQGESEERGEGIAGAIAELAATLLDQNELVLAERLFGAAPVAIAETAGERLLAYGLRRVQLMREKGDYIEAIREADFILPIVQVRLPDTHPVAMGLINQKAVCVWEAGKPEMATSMFDALATLHSTVHGNGHIDGLVFRMNSAACKFESGLFDQALSEEYSVADDCERYLGVDHPLTLTALSNLAVTVADDGRSGIERSIALDKKVLAGRLRVLRPGHRDISDSQLNLGDSYMRLGDLEQAERLLRSAIDGYLASLLGVNTRVLVARKTLAECLLRSGRAVEGFGILDEVERLFLDEHPENIGEIQAIHRIIAEFG